MRNANKQPSQRQLRVGEQLRHILVEILQRGKFHNEALLDSGRITVSEVRVSPDLKHATAFVLTLGGTGMEDVLPALNEAAPYFQREMRKQLSMKNTPRVRFVTDTSFDEAQKIETALREIESESAKDPRHDDSSEE